MNTHDIEQHARFEDWFEQAIGRVKSMDGEDTIVAYHCRKAWQAAIEPYAKRIAELEHQLEQIGAGGVDGRALLGDSKRSDDPRLDAPAKVGNTRFGEGVPWSTVIGAAQRYHAMQNTTDKEQDRINKAVVNIEALHAAIDHVCRIVGEGE